MSAFRRPDIKAKVAEAWGAEAPDWVLALAQLAIDTSVARAAKAIGYSPAVVSTVLGNSYAGNTEKVERAVRGALMDLKVECPVLGEIRADRCIANQRSDLNVTSNRSVRLWRACRGGCPNSFMETEGEKC